MHACPQKMLRSPSIDQPLGAGGTAAKLAQLAALSALLAAALLQLRRLRRLKADLQRAEDRARFEAEERRSERTGRVKAERELRQAQLRLGQLESGLPTGAGDDCSSSSGGAGTHAGSNAGAQPPPAESRSSAGGGSGGGLDWQAAAFPMRPVGLLRSCFSRRNGTPRQPLLVPAARARLTLRPDLSADFLDGLGQYSHCWVLYVFHENTDLQRLWQAGGRGSGVRAKIRPCPIGLSVAQVVSVEGRTLTIAGADIVDGSPVLDVKPFVPFCDNVPGATAPPWVAAEAEDEPLQIGALRIPPAAEAALQRCWSALGSRSLYRSFEQYKELVTQVLSRDIRSLTQRIKVPQRALRGGAAALCSTGGSGSGQSSAQQQQQAQRQEGQAAAQVGGHAEQSGQQEQGQEQEGFWKVVLDGILISYDVEGEGSDDVVLRSAACAASAALA